MFCTYCGKQLEDGSRFCQYCGKPLAVQSPPPPPETPDAPPAAEPVSIPFDPQVDIYPDLPPANEYPAAPAPIPTDANVYSDSVLPGTKKKRSNKTGLIVAIILVLALLIGGCFGFYLYTRQVYEKNLAAYDAAELLLKKGDYDGALEGFRGLGDFEDAAHRAEALEELQEAYDDALALLNAGKYSDAREAFGALGDYRDSNVYTEYGIDYTIASGEMNNASAETDADLALQLYTSAAERFTALGDYSDAAELASKCWLHASLILLEQGNLEEALGFRDKLNSGDAAYLNGIYAEFCSDASFLADLKEAMLIWYDTGNYYSYADELNAAWERMSPYETACFSDPALEYRLADFKYALQVMYNALDSEDTVGVWSEFYLGEYFLFALADQMYDEYGMFADDPANRSIFVGISELYYAYSVLEYSFECWLEDTASADQMEDGHYYATYTNDTGYSFDLYATIYFYGENDELLEVGDTMTIYVARGATVYIPTIPTTISDDAWQTWNIYWDFGNVS